MAANESKDLEGLNYQLWKHLIALSSMLEAFEMAAEYAMNGGGKEIDPAGMFSQCNLAMERVMTLHQELEQGIQALSQQIPTKGHQQR